MEIKRVLVPYSSEEDKKKLENYIEERTGRHVDLGPIGYGGDLTLQTMDVDFSRIDRTNITCARFFSGKRFDNVDEFIKWHSSEYRTDNLAKYCDIRNGMIRQLPVVYESLEECERLVSFLRKKGYRGGAGTRKVKALYIDNTDRTFHEPSTMIMACWCTGGKYPINAQEFMENCDRIIENPDYDFYYNLIARKYEERHRNAPEEQKPRVTADMLNRMVDDECIRRRLPLIKHSNKAGTKVIVRFSLPKESRTDINNGKEEK